MTQGAPSQAVGLADRASAPVLARLHLRAALAGFAHIFPAEAPPPTYDELLDDWERVLGPDWDVGRRAFVARREGEVVGVIVSGPDTAQPELGLLERLYVDPVCWARGTGRDLYRTAMAHLHGEGYPAAALWVLEGNDRARAWYERLGWRATGERRPVYEPAGIDDVRYQLSLEAVDR
jgi:ribosomal protein S18 acetylase RimI-like enzyme